MTKPQYLKKIEKIEKTATFKSFLRRIGFKSFSEYMRFFEGNIFKRKVATDWCLDTYPHLFDNIQEEWKQQKS